MFAGYRRLTIAAVLISSAAAAQAAPASPPKLVVVLVVDQMRADYISRYSHQWTGGLRRLVDGGAWFSRAAYPYLSTVTCVGHATVSTGAFPRSHGIVGNSWFDRDLGRSIGCTADPAATTVSYAAPVGGGHGPSRIASATLADKLRAQSPVPARVVTLSIEERTAITLVRLDRTLRALLDHLDRTVGAGRYVVALTGDHGAAPIPEQAAALGIDAGRLDVTLVRQAAQRALEAALGPGTHTVRVQGSDLILEPQAVERLRRDPQALDGMLRALRAVPSVVAAFVAEQLDAHAAAGDRDARGALLSYYPGHQARQVNRADLR
jgi:predicted AlkP superfamily pyrophosphatase or phosphodiesterase